MAVNVSIGRLLLISTHQRSNPKERLIKQLNQAIKLSSTNTFPTICYSNVKQAYLSRKLPKLGKADHNLIILQPKYRPLVRQKPRVITVKKWTQDAIEQLKCEFETTDWSVFTENSNGSDEVTEAVSAYINFCTENLIPKRIVKIYGNRKPWINGEVKDVIKKKRQAFDRGDVNELNKIQRELKRVIRKSKIKYKREIENNFVGNDMSKVWRGMRKMSGYAKSPQGSGIVSNLTKQYANELNTFFNRFDRYNSSDEQILIKSRLALPDESGFDLKTNADELTSHFKGLKASKSAGSDQILPKVLKLCATQLADIFEYIFNLIFETQTLPESWKTSCIIPISKRQNIQCYNDLRPVALTSVPMKVCEKIVLKNLKPLVADFLDPHQFAYRRNRNTEDPLIYKNEKMYPHLDNWKTSPSVRIMYFDFSSAFNTIQPHILINKLFGMNIPNLLISFVFNFLVGRLQFVRLNQNVRSDVIRTNTGAPQGWGGNINKGDKGRIRKVLERALGVIGSSALTADSVYDCHYGERLKNGLQAIMEEKSHPLHSDLLRCHRSGKFRPFYFLT
ncbi:uncharacterized protein [Antedon mediterranea]|uniref:uncharacterized protein n=1 Tax=Antedon mediterranea TaxID=105859 RepID=UPI003AF7AA32